MDKNDIIFKKKDYLRDTDVLTEPKESLADMLFRARKAAIKRGIEANSVFINTHMVEVPETWISDGFRRALELPPMICGMYAYFTKDELPDGYTFAVAKGPEHKTRLEEFESIGMEPDELRKAADLYRDMMERMKPLVFATKGED